MSIITPPVPNGETVISPLEFEAEIVLPSMLILSTSHESILPAASSNTADDAVLTPCTWSIISVKYLPPITSIFAASPAVSVPVPI